jgi:4-hydroxybenzoate polyprenyltransferase
MKMLMAIYDLFARRLRLSNPWNYKAPVLVAVTYLVMLRHAFAWTDALVAFAFAICTIVGIAGFGYWTNDLGDRKADRLAGKANPLATLAMPQIVGILCLWLALASLPWIVYFPVDGIGIGCLVVELLLFVLYVLPPFRLKERGLLGLVTDALYAHAIPAFLAALTFEALSPTPSSDLIYLLIGVVGWQFCLGLRNILLHQLKDAANDRRSGLRTYVTRVGEARAMRVLENIFVPMEVLTWLLLLGVLCSITWLPIAAWAIYLTWQYPRQKKPLDLRGWLYRYLDDFYIGWFPLLILLAACAQDWRMVSLLIVHIALFKSAVAPLRDRLISKLVKPS